MSPKFHSLRVGKIQQETPDAVSLCFDVPIALQREYAFIQGQHVTLRVRIGGEEMRRSYSICAGVDDGLLRIAVKRVPGGVFSNWVNKEMACGDTIDVLTPEGRFHTPLDAAHAKHYVAFAAGSGITPVLSLVKSTLAREPRSRFTLLYGNRRQSTVMFHEELEDLKDRHVARFALHHIFSRERQEAELFNGRLDAAKVSAFMDTLLPAETIDEAFVCGPGAMIDAVSDALRNGGVPSEHVHVERFGVPEQGLVTHHVDPLDALKARIDVRFDGVTREVEFLETDPSILDAALRSGLDLPYSCKGGMCCTCRAKVLSGRVRMDKNYSLEPRDLQAGFVLTCQAHPLTDEVSLSYDER